MLFFFSKSGGFLDSARGQRGCARSEAFRAAPRGAQRSSMETQHPMLQPSPTRTASCCILSRRPQFVPFLISRTGNLSYLSQCQEAFLKIQLLPLPLSVFQELSWGPINCIPFQMHFQHLKNKMSASKFISAFSSTL